MGFVPASNPWISGRSGQSVMARPRGEFYNFVTLDRFKYSLRSFLTQETNEMPNYAAPLKDLKFAQKITKANITKKSFIYGLLHSLRQKIDDPLGKKRTGN